MPLEFGLRAVRHKSGARVSILRGMAYTSAQREATMAGRAPGLRFAAGDRIECNMGSVYRPVWAMGTVTQLWHQDDAWPKDKWACRAACLPVASSPLSPDRLFATAVATFDAQQPSKPTCGAVLLAWRVFPTLSADRVLCFAVFEGPPGPHSEGTSKVRNGDFVKITVLGSKPDQCQDCGGSMATRRSTSMWTCSPSRCLVS